MKTISIIALAFLAPLCSFGAGLTVSTTNGFSIAQTATNLNMPNGGGLKDSFTNVALSISNNTDSGVMITNDTANIGSTNLSLAFTGGHVQEFLLWYEGPSIASYISANTTHGGSPSVGNTEFSIVNNGPGSAWLPGGGGTSSAYAQLGQSGQEVVWYINLDDAGIGTSNPQNGGSSVLVFRTSMNTNSQRVLREPGIFSYARTNVNQWELDLSADVPIESINNSFQSGYTKSNAIPGAAIYAGTNGTTPYHGVALYGANGTTTNILDVGPNGVVSTNGFGSYATNMISLSSTGITNTLNMNLRVVGFTGTTVTQTNTVSHSTFPLGTITQPALIILQPGEALRGSSCASVTNIAW